MVLRQQYAIASIYLQPHILLIFGGLLEPVRSTKLNRTYLLYKKKYIYTIYIDKAKDH